MTTTNTTGQAFSAANDGVAEPLQPNRTSEIWSGTDLWCNREGTVIRSGLYLRNRKEFAALLLDFQNEINSLKELIKQLMDGDTDNGTLRGLVWTEWTTLPFSNSKQTINFSKLYRSEPVVHVQVTESDSASPINIKFLTKTENSIKYYTGVEVTVPTGSGSGIMFQSIGRIG